VIGLVLGVIITFLGVILIGMPLAIGHRQDLPLERLYGDFAVGVASGMQGGSQTNPLTKNARALESGRLAYTGSCAICHGVNGDGRGTFGSALYPAASDLQAHDTQEKTDAQLFWIIKNGISFVGMPGYADRYDDSQIWALVTYTRSLGDPNNRKPGADVPVPTDAQLAVANPAGDAPQRGAAVYFAQGCFLCHGAVGNSSGQLRLRGAGEASEAVRRGKRGMPAYGKDKITEAELADLIAYLRTFGRGQG
jgi:mono/diheme cytochrome c family protein